MIDFVVSNSTNNILYKCLTFVLSKHCVYDTYFLLLVELNQTQPVTESVLCEGTTLSRGAR